MSDERTHQSVRELHLFEKRTERARQRREQCGGRCQIEVHPPVWHAKKRQQKRELNTRHGALHGVFGHEGCSCSTLRETTKVLVFKVRDPYAHLPLIPTVSRRA